MLDERYPREYNSRARMRQCTAVRGGNRLGMKHLCLFLVATIAIQPTLNAQQRGSVAEAKAAAEFTVRTFVDSWNREDGVAYGENYWPEAELVNPSGEIVEGRAAIAEEHVVLWSGIFNGSLIKAKVRRVTRLDRNHIIVDFDTELSSIHEPPPGAQSEGKVLQSHLKHVLEKRNGQWKVLSAQNTFISGK